MPRVASPTTRSKCGVAPRMTAPRTMSPSKRPVASARRARPGSSMAPGQRKSSTRAASAPVRRRASRAPSTSLSTMKSLKREATMANPRPAADRAPSWVRRPGSVPAPSFTSLLMPSLIPSTFSLAQPYHFRRGADREALDDLEPVAGHAHDAARVVREQADALDAEVREHLRPEAEVAQPRLARARRRGA